MKKKKQNFIYKKNVTHFFCRFVEWNSKKRRKQKYRIKYKSLCHYTKSASIDIFIQNKQENSTIFFYLNFILTESRKCNKEGISLELQFYVYLCLRELCGSIFVYD